MAMMVVMASAVEAKEGMAAKAGVVVEVSVTTPWVEAKVDLGDEATVDRLRTT
eukprot:CAMPEP_0206481288 /NCGR_PEP_ID=MMETSP0324_2-20121206/38047_1 /ASSEMBLY_ACC=CAM_ASM_000836 /TAXON_ID=2866 /ORGANISM="Crypthecodinium cohnii, Strain Seligo" /LENGTH=52 /DNA_ID=CAMNT_0053958731 /DNA_START=206 /DNA_END=361 /DNA_ORIENTATION=-